MKTIKELQKLIKEQAIIYNKFMNKVHKIDNEVTKLNSLRNLIVEELQKEMTLFYNNLNKAEND